MRALIFLSALIAALPARAGVAVSAEAGAEGTVPKISLQTSLSPTFGPSVTAALNPALAGAFSVAPSPLLTIPALPVSAITQSAIAQSAIAQSAIAQSAVTQPIVPAAAFVERPMFAAPSLSDDPKPAPESAATPASKDQSVAKNGIQAMLKSMASFFTGKKAEEIPPANESERLDREFAKVDVWGQVAPSARAEIEGLRARKLSKADLKAYVQAEADAAIERIKAARGVKNIGFHYNLHGGQREEYVGVGIRATMGDIALRYTMNGDTNHKVYFFQSDEHGGFTPLDSKHGEHLFIKMRMGYALSLFDLDAPALKEARADGRIKNMGSISMDFHGMKGVPYEAYLAPPVEVFTKTAKKIGMRKLSWDEETLATVRYLEATALEGGPYVPGGEATSAEAKGLGAAARSQAAASASPTHRIMPQFALVDNSFFYHGTTLDDLARVVDSGGAMAAEVSQFSLRARDSVEYAADRSRRLARPNNPEVLLQFRTADLSALVSAEQFSAALAATDRGMPPIHAAYSAATKPVPLSLMTPASKETLLAWLRARNDPRLARFTAALAPR